MAIDTAPLDLFSDGINEILAPATDLRADAVIALMREYEKKLRRYLHQFRQVEIRKETPALSSDGPQKNQLRRSREEIVKLTRRVLFPAQDLARHASAISEHGRIDRVTRLELRLRAAEFETAIEQALAEVR